MSLQTRAEKLNERIERGIQALRDYDPNWKEKIDLERLDMSDCHQCMIGQVVGHFFKYDKVVPHFQEPEQYGFEVDTEFSYTELTHAWESKLNQLLNTNK